MHGYDEASLYLYGLGDHGHLHVLTHSFPTLRSSELVFLIQALLQALDHAIRRALLDQAVPFEPLAVDLARRRMLGDLAVHQRLREGRLVGFVMAVPAIAPEVDHHVLLEPLTIFGRDARDMHAGFRIVPIDVEDRRRDDLGDIRTVG